MCGRYLFTASREAVANWFSLDELPVLLPRCSVEPSQPVPVVRAKEQGRECVLLRWGLIPSWAKDAKFSAHTINARAETLAEKPAYRNAFRRRRCLVPADGFYE